MTSVLSSGFSRFALASMLLTGLLVGATSAMAEASPRPATSSARAGTASLPTVRTSEAVPVTRGRPAQTWSPRAAAPTGGRGQVPPPAPAPAPAPTTPEAPAVEVMSFNIAHGRGLDGVVDLERTAQVIEASGADIVGLQEVDQVFSTRSGLVDQPAWLAERLGMHVVFGGNLASTTGRYGTAILSRYPIVEAVNHALPNHGHEQRGAQEVVLDAAGTRLRVINTHLTNSRVEAEQRAQIAALVDIVSDSTTPTFVLGDLNTVVATGLLDPLLDVTVDTVTGPTGQRKATALTYPAADPLVQLDYVLVGPGLTPLSGKAVSTAASDHLPLLAEVSLP